jgi:hypothetical protein
MEFKLKEEVLIWCTFARMYQMKTFGPLIKLTLHTTSLIFELIQDVISHEHTYECDETDNQDITNSIFRVTLYEFFQVCAKN